MEMAGHRGPISFEERLPGFQALLQNYPVTRNYGGGEASYNIGADVINMPHQNDFESYNEFLSTHFHELVHSTRHGSRLDREKTRGLKGYAFEELVAEIGAAFLCAHFGIDPVLQHPAYLTNYIAAMEADHKAILAAAADAQKATDYLLGFIPQGHTVEIRAAVAA